MGTIHWHRTKGLGAWGETADRKKSRQDYFLSYTFTADFDAENWEAAVMTIVFLILPGQLYSPLNEITNNTNQQSVMKDWLEGKKRKKSTDVWREWYVICIFSALTVTKPVISDNALPNTSTRETCQMIFSDLCLIAQWWHWFDAPVCEIKVFFLYCTHDSVKDRNHKFSFFSPFSLLSLGFLIICATFCLFIWTDDISHRLSHLLCLWVICLLSGSHQSSLRPGGFLQRSTGPRLGGQLSSVIHQISH